MQMPISQIDEENNRICRLVSIMKNWRRRYKYTLWHGSLLSEKCLLSKIDYKTAFE